MKSIRWGLSMTRIAFISATFLLFIFVHSVGAYADTRIRISDDVDVTKLTEHVWLHTTYYDIGSIKRCPANGLVMIDGSQAIVIDTPWTDAQTKLLFDWIESERGAKVAWIIPTHSHIDCAGGLAEAHRRGAASIALDKTAEILKRTGGPMPKQVFSNKRKLRCGDRSMEIAYLGAGHTVDNIVAWLPEEKTLFGGCMIKSMGARGMGNITEADLDAWPETLKAVKAAYPGVQRVVPGHGSPGSADLIDHTMALVTAFNARAKNSSTTGSNKTNSLNTGSGNAGSFSANMQKVKTPESGEQEETPEAEKPSFFGLPETVVNRAILIRERALKSTGAYDFLEELTTKIGHRLSGTENDRRAVEWAIEKMKAMGFSNVRTEEVTVPCWQRGSAIGKIVSPVEREFTPLALGGSVATPPIGIEADVIEVGGLEELAGLRPSQVFNKIVFFNQRMPRSRDGRGYGMVSPIRRHGPAEAGALGAVAAIVRSVSPSTTLQAHTGMTHYRRGVPKIPAVTLSNPEADRLEKALKKHKSVRFRLELDCNYLPDVKSANVMGEIVGREKPEEIVLICAHLDSWDQGTGAQDDGAGCAVIAEIGRLIGQLDPAPYRTLRVWFATNEEFGLAGGLDYARRHKDEMDRHVAAFEVDSGTGRVWGMQSKVSFWSRMAVSEIARLLEPLGVAYMGNDTIGGADLLPMMRYQVPLFTLNHDVTEYFDVYHSANDTLDKVDPDSLAQNVAAYAVIALVAADFEGGFGRAPKFRGTLPPPFDDILEGREVYR